MAIKTLRTEGTLEWSTTISSPFGYIWYDLNEFGTSLRALGLRSDAIITSAKLKVHISSTAQSSFLCQASLYDVYQDDNSSCSGLVIDEYGTSGSLSNYIEFTSENLINYMNPSDAGYFFSDRDNLRIKIYRPVLLKQDWSAYITFTVEYTNPSDIAVIEAINVMEGDKFCILDVNENDVGTSFDGTTVAFSFNAQSYDGRKISRIDLFFSTNNTDWTLLRSIETTEELISIGWVQDEGRILYLGNGASVFDGFSQYKLKCVVYFEEYMTVKIGSEDAKDGDYIQLFNSDKTQALGYKACTGLEGEKIYWRATAGSGRKIAGVTLRTDDTVYDLFGEDFENTFGHVINNEHTSIEEFFSCNDLTRGSVREVIVYFEDVPVTYAVYVGQIKALKVFVGTTEILKMV